MNNRHTPLAALLLSLALASSPAGAAEKPPADPTSDPVMVTSGFLSGHPDLRFRLLALQKRSEGKMEAAFGFFQRAAYYGDKPSAGMVAEMLWDGTGTAKDRASAYAWMDLAAERGYEGFLDLRERYWAMLDEAERKQAITAGQDIYARYGDAAALPRIATALRFERRRMTGSRTGFSANLHIIVPTPGGGTELIEGSKFYDERYWDPVQYQQWHDSIWRKPRVARVDIGEVSQLPQADLDTRIPKVEPAPEMMEPEPTDEMPILDNVQTRP
ncbi:MAG: hypothetical protein ACN6OU_02505 [Stenotrophomonas acidaminiphila]